MIDVITVLPGATPRETENLLVRPMEQRMWEIPGVEHVYSMAGDGMAMVTVRFKVGEDQELSVAKVHAKLFAAMDRAPAGAMPPLVKPHRSTTCRSSRSRCTRGATAPTSCG